MILVSTWECHMHYTCMVPRVSKFVFELHKPTMYSKHLCTKEKRILCSQKPGVWSRAYVLFAPQYMSYMCIAGYCYIVTIPQYVSCLRVLYYISYQM